MAHECVKESASEIEIYREKEKEWKGERVKMECKKQKKIEKNKQKDYVATLLIYWIILVIKRR